MDADDRTREAEDRAAREAAMAELRSLLLGPEQQTLDDLRRRLDDPALRAEDVGAVLAEAFAIAQRDVHLAEALAPTVEQALHRSVQRDPEPVADALFPVMGPAIRRAITHALKGVMQSFNQALEHSLSWRSLRWRLEAWRTGRPFAEVVLQHTLAYRVEQVFLIHRETGLPLQHVVAAEVPTQDADLVSGMLSAIQRFLQDSFRMEENDGLVSLEMGDLTVWIEPGPQAVLACVIRGLPPSELRETMQEIVEAVHRQYGRVLAVFDGDEETMAGSRPLLERALLVQYTEPPRSGWWAWGVLLLLLLAGAVWITQAVRRHQRWDAFRAAVAAEPGLVLLRAEPSGRPPHVEGLRDPLARDPALLLQAAGVSPDGVVMRWVPFQAADSALVLRRAVQVLQPPPDVTLRLQGTTLYAEGEAPPDWIAAARMLARVLPGVSTLDTTGLTTPAERRLRELRERIEAVQVRFSGRTTRLAPGQDAVLRDLAEALTALDAAAREAGRGVVVTVTGHTDATASAEVNRQVSRQRAERVVAALRRAGLRVSNATPGLRIEVRGVGADHPARPERTPDDQDANRRVSFDVRFSDTPTLH
ncbi:hypothetical protein AWN76_009920 [Rhodothermaceae bacterium RA]|nr:hypothetical protein AWN76_009920 [Rhodothermaceae bacterium RA]